MHTREYSSLKGVGILILEIAVSYLQDTADKSHRNIGGSDKNQLCKGCSSYTERYELFQGCREGIQIQNVPGCFCNNMIEPHHGLDRKMRLTGHIHCLDEKKNRLSESGKMPNEKWGKLWAVHKKLIIRKVSNTNQTAKKSHDYCHIQKICSTVLSTPS